MIPVYVDEYEEIAAPSVISLGVAVGSAAAAGATILVDRKVPSSAGGDTQVSASLTITGGAAMTLQDQLRGEAGEVSDTDLLLTQAADRIDELEALLAASGDPARIAELEQALDDITAIITAVST